MDGWMQGCRDAGRDGMHRGIVEMGGNSCIGRRVTRKDDRETYIEIQPVLELIHSWLEYSCNVIFVELRDGERMSAQMCKLPEGILPGSARGGFSLPHQETRRRREGRGLTAM
jgi:hypothetical protein